MKEQKRVEAVESLRSNLVPPPTQYRAVKGVFHIALGSPINHRLRER